MVWVYRLRVNETGVLVLVAEEYRKAAEVDRTT
jgi:hypothetical protein